MATQVQFRRGTTAETSVFTGADGEVTVDTTKKTCVVHDGFQVSGYPLLREDGSNSAFLPGGLSSCALKFVGDPNTGIYSPGSDQIGLVTDGVSRLLIDSSGSVTIPGNVLVGGTVSGAITFDDGSAAVPAIRFTNDPNTGIYRPGTDQVAISTNGVARLTTSTTAVSSSLAIDVPLGAVGTPSITFTGDLNTGFYSPAADTLAAVTAGANRLHITSGGLVGLGTSSPSQQLSVATGSGNCYIQAKRALQSSGQVGINLNGGTGGIDWFLYQETSTDDFRLYANGNDRVTFKSDGKVGIGTTSPTELLHINGNMQVGWGTYRVATVFDNNYRQGLAFDSANRQLRVFSTTNDSGGSIGFYTRVGPGSSDTDYGTERARIDSSGRLLVGTSTARGNFKIAATIYDAAQQLEAGSQGFQSLVGGLASAGGPYLMLAHQRSGAVGGNTVLVSGDEMGTVSFHGADGTNLVSGAVIRGEVDGTPGANDMPGRLVFSTTADGASSPTERMRVTSTGRLLIGQTGDDLQNSNGVSFNPNGNYSTFNHSGTVTGTGYLVFGYNGGLIGSITQSGTTQVAYNISSDYRLKENVVPLTNAISRINQLQVHRFNFIADPDMTVDGFIAHEAQAVVPECVTGTKDEVDENNNPVYQGIDQSKLMPLLTAALQEAIAKIETLEAKVAALEAS